MENKTIIV
jgi:hypothetical protein